MTRIISPAQLKRLSQNGAKIKNPEAKPDPGAPMRALEKTISEAMRQVTAAIASAAAKPAPPPAPILRPGPKAWIFDVHRNKDGLIETIIATEKGR